MARPIPPKRLSQLVRVATETFIARGYRQTQMADVADALGVAKGTLYGYVEGKEALFDAAVRFADGANALPSPDALPLATPRPGATVEYVRGRLAVEVGEATLTRVVRGTLTIDDPADELRLVLDDLHARLARSRFAIKLIDRCATDYPELAEAWFGEGRWAQHEMLSALIRRRIEDGSHRPVTQVEVVARLLLETMAFWAVHRHFDPAPQRVNEDEARREVVELLVRGLVEDRP